MPLLQFKGNRYTWLGSTGVLVRLCGQKGVRSLKGRNFGAELPGTLVKLEVVKMHRWLHALHRPLSPYRNQLSWH